MVAFADAPGRWDDLILVTHNVIPSKVDVAARIAAQTLAKRGPDYTDEVRNILDAAFAVIGQQGTRSRVRVADIVAAAGVSNDTFYRHFTSKDALIVALLEDGTERLVSYIAHQMQKAETPEDKVRTWVEAMLSQASGRAAAITLAVLWNGISTGAGISAENYNASVPLGALLQDPYGALGSSDPELDASLAAHATLGKVSDHLWAGTKPDRDEIEHIVTFCIGAARSER
jgi:AcrR family transcriptional regulator